MSPCVEAMGASPVVTGLAGLQVNPRPLHQGHRPAGTLHMFSKVPGSQRGLSPAYGVRTYKCSPF